MKKTFSVSAVLFASLLCCGAINISSSSPIRPGGAIVSGKADVRPHSGYAAIVATKKWGYQPLEIRLAKTADEESGIFRMEYYPYFSVPGSRITLLKSGDVQLDLDENNVYLKIGKESSSAAAKFQPGVWYDFCLVWENGSCRLKLQGKTLLTVKTWLVPVGKTLFIGGMPDGLLRNISIDRPSLSPVLQLDGKNLEFTVRANNNNSLCFDYFAHGKAAKIRMCPAMPVYPGEKFVIIQSSGDPMYVTAEKSGFIDITLPPSYSNRVELRRDKGNLFADPSFEKFPANWQITSQMEYAKASAKHAASVKAKVKPQIPTSLPDFIKASTAEVRSGKSAVLIGRQHNYGQITMSSQLKVAPKTRYLLHVYYKALECSSYKASLILQVKLSANGKQLRHFRKYHPSSPLRRSGNWEIAPMMFETPAAQGELTAQVEIISDCDPCRIALDDISLREYPTLLYNPMPGDVDTEKILIGKKLLDHIAKRPVVQLPKPPISAVSGYDGNIYKMMDRAKADMFFVKVNVDHRWRKPAWEADGSYDFSGIDEQILHVLSYAPDSVVALAIGMDPPLEFGNRYKEAAWRNISGKIEYMRTPDLRFYPERNGKYPYVSFTAPDFRREAGKFLYALGKYLKSKPWGKTIGGIQLVGGGDGQWFYRPRKNDFADMMDFSPGNLKAMRQAIRRCYNNDISKLRKAWGEPAVTFDTITFPKASLYKKYSYLRDPNVPEIRKVIDFARLYPQVITETLGFAASEFERGLGRKIIKARYYFGTSLGHLLAESPFDMLISVPPYGVSRLHGHAGRVHQAPGSAKLYGKYYLDELDLRTSYSPLSAYGTSNSFRHNGVEYGPEGFANMMRKMAAPNLVADQGYWYMMIGGNASLQQEMEVHVKESFDAIKAGRNKAIVDPGSPIALFWDEEARTLMGERFGWAVEQHSIHQLQKILSRTGIGYQMYLLQDLTHPKRPAAKINIFAIGSSLNEKQIAYVEKNLQKDNNVLIFVFDAGRTAPGGFEKNIFRLTGMKVKSANRFGSASFSTAQFPDPLSGQLTPATPIFNGPFMIPLYCVDDISAEPLALLAQTNLVGAAIKRHKNWTAVYVSIPLGMAAKPEFFRELAKQAGIRPNAPAQDVSSIGNGYITIHAVTTGKKTLSWQENADVFDITSGKIIKRNTKTLTLDMKFGETRWFRLFKPGQK